MLVADLAASPASQAYSTNVQQVWSFVKKIEVTNLPPNLGYPNYNSVTAPFTKTRSDALQWVNNFYPACLQLPQQIVEDGQQITPALNTLMSAAQQLQSQPNNTSLHADIIKSAQSLVSLVSGLLSQINTLVGDLQGFSAAIQHDVQSQFAALHQMNIDNQNLIAQIHSLFGQLHSLESATCPNKGAINDCERQIGSAKDQLSVIAQLSPVLVNLGSISTPALQGLQYLANYWASTSGYTQTTLTALQRTVSDPAVVLQLDLNAAQSGWNQILTFANNTASQISSGIAKAA